MDAEENSNEKSSNEILLASIPNVERLTNLAFDNSGQWLLLFSKSEPGVVDVRSWDLSSTHKLTVNNMSHEALLDEGCMILRQFGDPPRTSLNAAIVQWGSIGSAVPCSDHS
jgi:hypothetical protein